MAEFLRRSALFTGIDAALVERLAQVAVTRHYARADQLWRVGVLSRWERDGIVRTDADGFTLSDLPRLAELGDAAPHLHAAS